ncbi:hypothetical protein WN55_02819, partial [Dufourea novaeangliae]
ADNSGWSFIPNTQYHIQTDEGPERHFRFQTLNGQYRKEKRLVDGTVIGTEGWLDPLGYLRLKDYVADSKGFRILRSKMIYVGKGKPIYDTIVETKGVPPQTGILVDSTRPPNPFRHWKTNNVAPLLENDINSGFYVTSTVRPRIDVSPVSASNEAYYNTDQASFSSGLQNVKNYPQLRNTYYNLYQRSDSRDNARYKDLKNTFELETPTSRSKADKYPPYDGTHSTSDGFQYYLRRQYHEEERDSTGSNVGSFGYIDPFGIRRVIYYKTDSNSGNFHHLKNNKYVGFAGTPYDPSPMPPLRQNK